MAADMARLEPFVGAWNVETSLGDARATTTFDWALDRRFLLQRSEIDLEMAPNGLMILAPASSGEGYTQHYFDSRGVIRLYAMTFEDGIWTLQRDEPDFSPLDFHQRYTGEFSGDGSAIEGRWETSDDGVDWKLDFELSYRRL
jgi:hypothetical protein